MLLHSMNPATGETLRSFPTLTEGALHERIGMASGAAAIHAALPIEHRVRCLRKLAELLTEEQTELARAIAVETGKPVRLATEEIARCADACRHYAENAVRMLQPEMLQTVEGSARKRQSHIAWNSVGVVLVVLPGESPMWQACRVALPALTAGNAMLLKHAASVPQCAILLETLVRRAGFCRGLLSALLIDDRLVKTALHDPRVTAMSVTGAESVVRALAAQAGWLMKRSSLHVMGNGAMIVMPSADMERALAAAVEALAGGTGAGKRLILHSDIYNDFVRGLIGAIETLTVGDPLRSETEVGPLGTMDAVQQLCEQVDATVQAGGRVLTGGARLLGAGSYFEPTLLNDVPRDSSAANEVLAGPVAMIFRARDLEDALSLANSTMNPGECSVWTREPAEQHHLIIGLRGRSVTLNASPRQDWQLGASALREFVEAKVVTLG